MQAAFENRLEKSFQWCEGGLSRNVKYLDVKFVGSLIVKMVTIHIWQQGKHQRIKMTIIYVHKPKHNYLFTEGIKCLGPQTQV